MSRAPISTPMPSFSLIPRGKRARRRKVPNPTIEAAAEAKRERRRARNRALHGGAS